MSRQKRKLTPIHPKEFLLVEFLLPIGISQYRLRINEVVWGQLTISGQRSDSG